METFTNNGKYTSTHHALSFNFCPENFHNFQNSKLLWTSLIIFNLKTTLFSVFSAQLLPNLAISFQNNNLLKSSQEHFIIKYVVQLFENPRSLGAGHEQPMIFRVVFFEGL